jgi:hypothetical protein
MQTVIDSKMMEDNHIRLNQAGPSSKFLKPLPRLERDFKILKDLTSPDAPPKVVWRRTMMGSTTYGFGDASGKGFGHAIQVEGTIHSEFGQ